MNILSLATPSSCTRAALQAAQQLLQAAGEIERPLVTILVSPDEWIETKRLVESMQGKGELSRGAAVHANYSWDGRETGKRWAVIGRDAMVYVPGAA